MIQQEMFLRWELPAWEVWVIANECCNIKNICIYKDEATYSTTAAAAVVPVILVLPSSSSFNASSSFIHNARKF